MAVKIVPYDNRAPKIFQSVKPYITKIIPYEIEIEHIGSTAVEGLGGKGIIDAFIITKRKGQLAEIAEILRNDGFSHNPDPRHEEDRYFVSGPFRYNEADLHIHIHITFQNSKAHKDMLGFRDYLRQHPDEANRYYELKKQWSREATKLEEYTKLKTNYIHEVLNRARKH